MGLLVRRLVPHGVGRVLAWPDTALLAGAVMLTAGTPFTARFTALELPTPSTLSVAANTPSGTCLCRACRLDEIRDETAKSKGTCKV